MRDLFDICENFCSNELIVLPVIQASENMRGRAMAEINDAIRYAVDGLCAMADDGFVDMRLSIAPLKFSTSARWMGLTDGNPTEVCEFCWTDISAEGINGIEDALSLLEGKLKSKERGGWMEKSGCHIPVIILVSAGDFTDSGLDGEIMRRLKKSVWFKRAIKIAVSVSCDENEGKLESFTGNKEAVFFADSTEDYRLRDKIISVITNAVRVVRKLRYVEWLNDLSDMPLYEDSDPIEEKQKYIIKEITDSMASGEILKNPR